MKYRKTQSKLSQLTEKALTPWFLVFMILFVSPLVLGTILSVIDLILKTSLVILIGDNEQYILISSFLGLPIFIVPVLTIIFNIHYLGSLFEKQKENFRKSIDELESIELIQKKLMQIGETIKKILFLRRILSFITTKKSFTSVNQYFETEIGIFIASIMNLRSDLATRLTEQQQILEGAKSEVEQNITGTPELLAVSEAQKVRLDRQIEQFEEL